MGRQHQRLACSVPPAEFCNAVLAAIDRPRYRSWSGGNSRGCDDQFFAAGRCQHCSCMGILLGVGGSAQAQCDRGNRKQFVQGLHINLLERLVKNTVPVSHEQEVAMRVPIF